jgi:hypothetical protein
MTVRAAELWQSLEPKGDERVVVSAVFEDADRGLVLRCASVIIGPPAIAEAGWPEWRVKEGVSPAPSEPLLGLGASFVVRLDGVLVGRAAVSLGAARDWVTSTLDLGRCPELGPLPAAQAHLAEPRAPIRVTTHSETSAGDLAVWLARPLVGFFLARTDQAAQIEPADSWEVKGRTIFSPAINLLGIAWFGIKTGPPPLGLLLARMERQAWLAGQTLRPEDALYEVRIGLEPGRVDPADLEIEIEERANDELVWAERLRMEDVDLREVHRQLSREVEPTQPGRPVICLNLPTLGRKIKRVVRLHHRDGGILDEWQSFNIVESIGLTLEVDGARQPTRWSGDTRGPPDLAETLGAVARVRQQFVELRRGGLSARLFDRQAEGREELRRILERVTGELLVLDPWLRDWNLLTDLVADSRVLIGADVPDPPSEFAGKVGRWSRPGAAPFHDRFFLWEGGGLSVGTSAGSRRDRLFRLVRIGAVESEELRDRFSLWWSDPGFRKVR